MSSSSHQFVPLVHSSMRMWELDSLTRQLRQDGLRVVNIFGWMPGVPNHRRFFWCQAQFDFPAFCVERKAHWCERCDKNLQVLPAGCSNYPCYLWNPSEIFPLAFLAAKHGHGFILYQSLHGSEARKWQAENKRTVEKHHDLIEMAKVLSVCS